MYQRTRSDSIILRLHDGVSFPVDPLNGDYAEYAEWVAQGNAPLPYAPPQPTPESIIAGIDETLEARLDALAQAWGYRNSDRLATYAASATYGADAAAFIAYRDALWTYANGWRARAASGEVRVTDETVSAFWAEVPPAPTKPEIAHVLP